MLKKSKQAFCALALPMMLSFPPLSTHALPHPTQVSQSQAQKIVGARQINTTTVELVLSGNKRVSLDFYGNDVFRIFHDPKGGIIRDPQAKPEAQILVDQPRKEVTGLAVKEQGNEIIVTTSQTKLVFNKENTTFKVYDLANNKLVAETIDPITVADGVSAITFKENPQEYFYGGGVQNGRFSHKGKLIDIENQNSWTDGGVASPTPYYWSTNGYAVMWHTFKKGEYDFGSQEKGEVHLSHQENYLDMFLMVGDGIVDLLNGFYQLTGNPVLLPKFAFYQGHLNAYNRDYWVEDEKGILFEDGKKYKESQKDNGGTKESLNGEKGNYQFSARAVIDRYAKHDMPFGWLLPNDGYGAGYGQTQTLDSNIMNLRQLTDYAQKKGVEIGLWTQSDLHPIDSISALLQRDIVKEVRDAGVRVLKTDVAWVGAGYSFGLNGIADAAQIMTYYGDNCRPFIISLDGWAGTQRYAGIWSGDQSGGNWEYIRFHIPTYLGSGLSGQPNISSDMDGIFGGKNLVVNTRDFQWKTFTPMELNMDGWGANEKYPHALGEPATSINRWYLKMKSEIMPYAYSIAKESVDGLPMIRAMFLEYPNTYTLGKSTQYQFLYGPNFLVAPIYQETEVDEKGNDIRDGIYLPKGKWIDYFNGDCYEGDVILNNYDSPLWKLPVFVKSGAIIPMVNPNNNVKEINQSSRIYEVYPDGYSSFTEYDDDGITEAYRLGEGVTTLIESNVDKKGVATISIQPTKGDYKGFVKEKETIFKVNTTTQPKKVTAKIGKKKQKLTVVNSLEQFENGTNVAFYNEKPEMNQWATPGTEFEKVEVIKNPQVWVKLASTDVTANGVAIELDGYEFDSKDPLKSTTEAISGNLAAKVEDKNLEAYIVTPTWNKVENADFYEIEFNGQRYTGIRNTHLKFDELEAEKEYQMKLRAVNKHGASKWETLSFKTKSNPLEFAIKGITAETTAANQGGSGIDKLFDFDESNTWHTKWGVNALPFDMIIDLNTINHLDKFHYLPRSSGGNGVLQEGTIFISSDKKEWTKVTDFNWEANGDMKVVKFEGNPKVRYIKLAITKGVGGFGSGTELYVFKVPGTESYIPGDINNDRLVDANDLTSYMNYTGLRKGDSDFEGYISNGDLNQNGLIDAYDISVVGTRLEGKAKPNKKDTLAGTVQIKTSATSFKAGDIVTLKISGKDMSAVNAISFALPYNTQDFEYVGIEAQATKDMENLTYDRLHTNRDKALYPTFVNLGDKATINGNVDLFTIKLKAKRTGKFTPKMVDGIIVDKALNSEKF